jgi:hypothetical protein
MVITNRNPAGRSVLGIHACRDIPVSHLQLDQTFTYDLVSGKEITTEAAAQK